MNAERSGQAAIEAAARALDPLAWRDPWPSPRLQEYAQGVARDRAAIAVDAAAPLLQAAALRGAADAVYGDERAEGPHGHPLSIATWLRERAARIERGES